MEEEEAFNLLSHAVMGSREKLSDLEHAMIFQDEKFSQDASRDDLLIKNRTE